MRLISKEHPRRALSRFPAQEVGRPRAPRLQNTGTGQAAVDWYTYYDIYGVAPGNPFPTWTLFSQQQNSPYAQGGVVSFNKSACHTNLLQGGKLNGDDSLSVHFLALVAFAQQGAAHPNLHIEDLNNFLMSYAWFKISDLMYFEGQNFLIPGGAGPVFSGLGTLTAPASASASVNGVPVSSNVYKMVGNVSIDPGQTFQYYIDPTKSALAAGGLGAPSTLAAAGNPTGVPAAGLFAWCRLEGQRVRQTQ